MGKIRFKGEKNFYFYDEEIDAFSVFCKGMDGLYNGFFICDKEDEHLLKNHKWYQVDGYVRRNVSGVKNAKIQFHREIISAEIVDHINQNPLDNRRSNLRAADKRINTINRSKKPRSNTGYKGIYKTPSGGFSVRMHINGSYRGWDFRNIEEAIKKRKELERQYHGNLRYESPLTELESRLS